MTQEAKIIGIVKAIQNMKSSRRANPSAADEWAAKEFPRVAQALLIAVEALEKIKEKEYSSDEDDLNCVAHRCCCGAITYKSHHSDCEVMNALSKISSL